MTSMLNVLEVAASNPTLEALPPRPQGHGTRGSTPGEPSERQNNSHLIESSRLPSSPSSRLPGILRGIRVLVVDDDEDTVELFAAALTACGAEAVIATSASEALGLVTLRSPDVVVSDIAMPGADGYWLVREIHRLTDEHLRAIPVIAVTAFDQDHAHAQSLAAGFVDHLAKPVEPEVLCRAVARANTR